MKNIQLHNLIASIKDYIKETPKVQSEKIYLRINKTNKNKLVKAKKNEIGFNLNIIK